MIRYRCPHCAALIVAHERRAGQSSVCKACVKPHRIPADQSAWLNESGEPLHPPEPVVPVEVPAPVEVLIPEPIVVALPPPVESRDALAPTRPDIQLPDPVESEPVAPLPPPPVPNPEPVIAASHEQEPLVTAPAPARHAPRSIRSFAPVVESAPAESEAVATATPPPASAPALPDRGRTHPAPAVGSAPRRTGRFAPVPVSTSAPEPIETGHGEPVQLQTQADIAVALTAALTTRMKPPAAPRRDLRPSTAAWMLLTGAGVALALLAVFSDPGYRWAAFLAGTVQIVCGYAWIVRLTHLRDPKRAALCALPPLTFVYLAQYKYAKLRPLRFVLTGLALVGIAVAAPALHDQARGWAGRSEPPAATPVDPTNGSKLDQLRHYRERQAYDPLIKTLDLLAKTDSLLSKEAKDKEELAAELKALCQHPDAGVKVRAMAAYARWDHVGARAVCLAAVRSQAPEEREEALRLLPQWKDAESARAVQSLIGRPGTVETNRAKTALEEIGGPPAEQAAIALLNRSDDQATRLTALAILEKVGGADGLAFVQSYALATDDPAVRTRALTAVETIGARVRAAAP